MHLFTCIHRGNVCMVGSGVYLTKLGIPRSLLGMGGPSNFTPVLLYTRLISSSF